MTATFCLSVALFSSPLALQLGLDDLIFWPLLPIWFTSGVILSNF
jgi:hypothetical protein